MAFSQILRTAYDSVLQACTGQDAGPLPEGGAANRLWAKSGQMPDLR